MLTKEKVIQAIEAMPEEGFENLDALLERLVVLESLEQAEEDIKAGRVYTNEQMKELIQLWSQSSGRREPTTT